MVYVFLADGFEEIEALGTVDILRRCELDVKTVSIGENLEVNGTHGIKVLADIKAEDVDENDLEAVVLPGGLPGADNLENCKFVTDLVTKAANDEKIVAAICAAPKILGVLGLLVGVKATCYPGFEARLFSAKLLKKRVVCDKNFITAKGAGVTHEFALAIATALKKRVLAKCVLNGMFY